MQHTGPQPSKFCPRQDYCFSGSVRKDLTLRIRLSALAPASASTVVLLAMRVPTNDYYLVDVHDISHQTRDELMFHFALAYEPREAPPLLKGTKIAFYQSPYMLTCPK